MTSPRVRHLYVHVPFCAHRCGYCDFVTVVGRRGRHEPYVEALLAELELEREVLADELESVFLGGGTPTFTDARAFDRLLDALPAADEVTVEANPETVTPALARRVRAGAVNRVSLGAQSFQPHLLATLERRAGPDVVRRAFYALRDASLDNISLDLLYGIPGQSTADLTRDLELALELGPEHLSCYELEAKPGTRFTHTHGDELARQAEAMEGYLEAVVATLTDAGYRWYETASFCLAPDRADGRDLRALHYLGIGIGAVSTVAGVRWRNRPSLARYLEALARRMRPPREVERLAPPVRARERLLLGLRLDTPVARSDVSTALDATALDRLERLGLLDVSEAGLALTRRGRFVGGAVTADLLA